jgi:hypothetical protein
LLQFLTAPVNHTTDSKSGQQQVLNQDSEVWTSLPLKMTEWKDWTHIKDLKKVNIQVRPAASQAVPEKRSSQ